MLGDQSTMKELLVGTICLNTKYVSFLVHLIIFSQLHMYREHKQNDARHGTISDGNTYTIVYLLLGNSPASEF